MASDVLAANAHERDDCVFPVDDDVSAMPSGESVDSAHAFDSDASVIAVVACVCATVWLCYYCGHTE